MVLGSPSMCISTSPASSSRTTSNMSGSSRPALTSLTIDAPASSAAPATEDFRVSIEIGTSTSAARRLMTGTTRSISSFTGTRSEPGRVDSPPTSSRSAPCVASSTPRRTAASGSRNSPPSENESGVTFTTPIRSVREPSSSAPEACDHRMAYRVSRAPNPPSGARMPGHGCNPAALHGVYLSRRREERGGMMRAEIGRGELEHVSETGRLGELYRLHSGDAARLAYLITGDRALAEDLVQEAFVRLYGKFRDLRNPDAFEFYLRRTVVNL